MSASAVDHGRAIRAVALLASAALLLMRLGPMLEPPPITSLDALLGWLDGREPLPVAFGVLHLAALAMTWYLLLVTTAGVLATSVGASRLAILVDAATPRRLQRAIRNVAGMGITAGALTVGLAPAARPLTDLDALRRQPPPSSTEAPSTARMRLVPSAAGDATATMRELAPDEPPPGPEPQRPGEEQRQRRDVVTVEPGDHLWAIAEAAVGERLGRAPTDGEVAPYWHALIEANRASLIDPDNPHLIVPGQRFVLPPVL